MFNFNDIITQQQNKKPPTAGFEEMIRNSESSDPVNNEAITNQLNSILSGITEKAACGPVCQRDKKANELKKKYLEAKENVRFAPEKYNDAEKNYFRFINGENWWRDYKKEQIEKKTRKELRARNRRFEDFYRSTEKGLLYYKSQFENKNNLNDILNNIDKKLSNFKKSKSDKEKVIQTSYRKSTYYNKEIKNIESYISVITKIYFALVIALSVSLLFFFGEFKKPMTIIMIILLAIYPFVITDIHLFIVKTFHDISSNIRNLDQLILSG